MEKDQKNGIMKITEKSCKSAANMYVSLGVEYEVQWPTTI